MLQSVKIEITIMHLSTYPDAGHKFFDQGQDAPLSGAFIERYERIETGLLLLNCIANQV